MSAHNFTSEQDVANALVFLAIGPPDESTVESLQEEMANMRIQHEVEMKKKDKELKEKEKETGDLDGEVREWKAADADSQARIDELEEEVKEMKEELRKVKEELRVVNEKDEGVALGEMQFRKPCKNARRGKTCKCDPLHDPKEIEMLKRQHEKKAKKVFEDVEMEGM